MSNAILAGWFAGLSAVSFVGMVIATDARVWIAGLVVCFVSGLTSFHFAEKFFGGNNQS